MVIRSLDVMVLGVTYDVRVHMGKDQLGSERSSGPVWFLSRSSTRTSQLA